MPERVGEPVAVTVHFLVPDERGPVYSGKALVLGRLMGTGRRYRVACGAALGKVKAGAPRTDRPAHAPWQVTCAACKATAEFAAAYRGPPAHPRGAHPGAAEAHRRLRGNR